MRFQFSTATMLLAVTSIAITCGSIIAWSQILLGFGFQFNVAYELMNAMAFGAVMWLPFVFVAYSVGRRQLNVWATVAFAIAEAAALVAYYLVLKRSLTH